MHFPTESHFIACHGPWTHFEGAWLSRNSGSSCEGLVRAKRLSQMASQSKDHALMLMSIWGRSGRSAAVQRKATRPSSRSSCGCASSTVNAPTGRTASRPPPWPRETATANYACPTRSYARRAGTVVAGIRWGLGGAPAALLGGRAPGSQVDHRVGDPRRGVARAHVRGSRRPRRGTHLRPDAPFTRMRTSPAAPRPSQRT